MGRRQAALMCVWLVVSGSGVTLADGLDGAQQRDPASPRIRPADRESASILKDGLSRSPTLRSLSAEVEVSDVLVFVMGSREPGIWRGDTRFMSAGDGVRMLGVRINMALDQRERLAVLGHELQHVLEISAEPDVVDVTGMRRLFTRLGNETGPAADRYETRAAQTVERRVREEVARSR